MRKQTDASTYVTLLSFVCHSTFCPQGRASRKKSQKKKDQSGRPTERPLSHPDAGDAIAKMGLLAIAAFDRADSNKDERCSSRNFQVRNRPWCGRTLLVSSLEV